MAAGSVVELTAALIAAKERKSKAEEALKEANAEVATCTRALFDAMVDQELERVSANGFTFSPDLKDYYRVPVANMDAFHDAMDAINYGGIFKVTANAQTINSTLRTLADNNGGELPVVHVPGIGDSDGYDVDLKTIVEVYSDNKVNMRKAAAKGGA